MSKISIKEFIDNPSKYLFEANYSITSPCRYKQNGRWKRAKIDLKNGIVFDMSGNVLRRCIHG